MSKLSVVTRLLTADERAVLILLAWMSHRHLYSAVLTKGANNAVTMSSIKVTYRLLKANS